MRADCHMHTILDGIEWRSAIARHNPVPDEAWIHAMLKTYQELGFTYLRDGGDRWGAGAKSRELAPQYGITYRTPLAPLCKAGHYGTFIGEKYENFKEYAELVKKHRQKGADFIKIMISGLMDFDRFGHLTEPGFPAGEIKELSHIAHEEGFSVMAHCNGARTAQAAAEAGVDSIEHGAYLDAEALQAIKETGTVWVPTVSTVGNLLGKGRFREDAVKQILDSALGNLDSFRLMGGLIAPGTDAGAWAVEHGCQTEEQWLSKAGVTQDDLAPGIATICNKF